MAVQGTCKRTEDVQPCLFLKEAFRTLLRLARVAQVHVQPLDRSIAGRKPFGVQTFDCGLSTVLVARAQIHLRALAREMLDSREPNPGAVRWHPSAMHVPTAGRCSFVLHNLLSPGDNYDLASEVRQVLCRIERLLLG